MIGDQVRLVLFDLGGVLVDLAGDSRFPTWICRSLSPDDMWTQYLTSPIVRAFETGKITAREFARQLIQELKLTVNDEELLREFARWPKGLFPGALELLGSISPKYIKATLTNNNCLHWPRCMDEMGLGNLFDLHYASHLTGRIKPDENAFTQVMKATACKPAEILFLDDNKLNVEAAKRLGIQAVQVYGVSGAEKALLEKGIIRNKQ